MSTSPIDQPFRLTRGFLWVWACLFVLACIAVRRLETGPWYSQAGFLIFLPFLLTFAVYSPIMFFRAAVSSGARGRFVTLVLVRVITAALVFFGGFFLSGLYTENRASLLGGVFVMAATVYVKLKLYRYGTAELGTAPNCGSTTSVASSEDAKGPQSVT
jgi:hypothetical protein